MKTAFRAATIVLLVVILAVLLLPRIDDKRNPGVHESTTRVQRAMTVAKKRWGPVCGGQPVVVMRGNLDAKRLAQASWEFPAGSADDPSRYYNCRITFRGGRIPYPVFCTGIFHEVAHLDGYRAKDPYTYTGADGERITDIHHAASPRSAMYPRQQTIWPGCGKTRPRTTMRYEHWPLGSPPPVTVLLTHGGGWLSGSPEGMEPQARDLRAHGYNARSISYPLGSVAGALEGVRRAVAAVKGPVVLYGVSAGGTLAAALAASGDVAGAINVSGPTDLPAWMTPSGLELKHRLRISRAEQEAVSPRYRLRGKQTAQLLQCGIGDPLVEYFGQCERYVRGARAGNPDTTLQQSVAHGQALDDHARARAWIQARWP